VTNLPALFKRETSTGNILACGLAGYSGAVAIDPIRLLKLNWLLAANEVRGDDSTGVYGNHLFKDAIKSTKFIHLQDYPAAVLGAHTVIGHTRKGTVGEKTQANSHPFEVHYNEHHVVGTHNGWIYEPVVKRVAKEFEIGEDDIPAVDSEFVYQVIAKTGFDYDRALSRLEGAMALAFVRPSLPFLHLYRRESRPLYVGWDRHNTNDMYYSSLAQPLENIGCINVQELDEHQLHVFHNGGLVEVSPVKKPVILSLKEGTPIETWKRLATSAELLAAGFPAVDVTTNVNMRALPPARNNNATTKGAGAATTTNQSLLFPKQCRDGGELPFLNQVIMAPFLPSVDLDNVDLGRVYFSADSSICTILFKLVDSSTNVELAGWKVSTEACSTIQSCFTAYNGLGVLQIPKEDCGGSLSLVIMSPVGARVYRVDIVKIEASRVLEVTLSVPFRTSQKEAEEQSQGAYCGQSCENDGGDGTQTANGSFSSILNQLERKDALDAGRKAVPKSTKRVLLSPGRGRRKSVDATISTEHRTGRNESVSEGVVSSYSLVRHEVDPLMTNVYDPLTDVLTMDYYNLQTNRDELDAHVRKASGLLNQVDIDERDTRQYLQQVVTYMEYLSDYFKMASKHHETVNLLSNGQEEN
jgi:hypothetical protein